LAYSRGPAMVIRIGTFTRQGIEVLMGESRLFGVKVGHLHVIAQAMSHDDS
jgi:hypothetical protein